jgi:hypothetical protein
MSDTMTAAKPAAKAKVETVSNRQIAIALASITVLTKKRWLLAGAGAAAVGGAIFGVIAWF